MCPHGYPPETCLICQTLGTSSGARGKVKQARAAGKGAARAGWFGRGAMPVAPRQAPPAQVPRTEVPRRLGVRRSALVIVLALIAVLGVIWAVAGVVFAILRLVELLAAIIVAGWVGYRVGVARGRRGG